MDIVGLALLFAVVFAVLGAVAGWCVGANPLLVAGEAVLVYIALGGLVGLAVFALGVRA